MSLTLTLTQSHSRSLSHSLTLTHLLTRSFVLVAHHSEVHSLKQQQLTRWPYLTHRYTPDLVQSGEVQTPFIAKKASAYGDFCCACQDDRVVVWEGAALVADFFTPEDISTLKLQNAVYTLSPTAVRSFSFTGHPVHTMLLQDSINGFSMLVHPCLYLSDQDTLSDGNETLLTSGYACAIGRRIFYTDMAGCIGVHTPGTEQERDYHIVFQVSACDNGMQVAASKLYALDDEDTLHVWK